MATSNLHQHELLAKCADQAHELEELLLQTRSVLSAIRFGELLVSLPADEGDDRDRHNSAVDLLRILEGRIRAVQTGHGDELSNTLRNMQLAAN